MAGVAAPRRLRDDSGAGLISTASGVLVVIAFLMFAVQLLFGLYASTVVTAVANDAARRAATAGAPDRAVIVDDARRGLGRVGDTATFRWSDADQDGDGVADTVVLTVVAHPPRFVPPSIGGLVGLDRIERTVRVRAEGFR
jgi:Flp pilus assembly protein TadG